MRTTDAKTQHLDKTISFCPHCQESNAEKEGGVEGEDEDLEESKLLKSWKDPKLGGV